MKKAYLLYILSFLAAFLIFQIESIMAKIFLPKYGGTYLVWGGCVVFFQCTLLFGYWYAHWVIRKFGFFKYRCFHLLLIFLPLLFFPGRSLSVMAQGSNASHDPGHIPKAFLEYRPGLLCPVHHERHYANVVGLQRPAPA